MRTSKKQKTHTEYYPNLKACAAAQDVSVAVLKLAKSMNCPGFAARGGVDWAQAAPWIEENQAEMAAKSGAGGKDFWEVDNLSWKARRTRLEYEVAAGLYYRKSDVDAAVKKYGELQKTMLLAKCRNELAQKVHGLTIPQTIAVLEKFAIEVCEIHEKGLEKWST